MHAPFGGFADWNLYFYLKIEAGGAEHPVAPHSAGAAAEHTEQASLHSAEGAAAEVARGDIRRGNMALGTATVGLLLRWFSVLVVAEVS